MIYLEYNNCISTLLILMFFIIIVLLWYTLNIIIVYLLIQPSLILIIFAGYNPLLGYATRRRLLEITPMMSVPLTNGQGLHGVMGHRWSRHGITISSSAWEGERCSFPVRCETVCTWVHSVHVVQRSTMYSVQAYNVRSTLYYYRTTLYSVRRPVYRRTIYAVHCNTLYAVQCSYSVVQCSLSYHLYSSSP